MKYHLAGLAALYAAAHPVSASVRAFGIPLTLLWLIPCVGLLGVAVYRYGRSVCA